MNVLIDSGVLGGWTLLPAQGSCFLLHCAPFRQGRSWRSGSGWWGAPDVAGAGGIPDVPGAMFQRSPDITPRGHHHLHPPPTWSPPPATYSNSPTFTLYISFTPFSVSTLSAERCLPESLPAFLPTAQASCLPAAPVWSTRFHPPLSPALAVVSEESRSTSTALCRAYSVRF